VILFKSSKITESKDNQVVFHHLIDNLKDSDLNVIKNQTNISVLIQAFDFFVVIGAQAFFFSKSIFYFCN
jgi:hypothetical protein